MIGKLQGRLSDEQRAEVARVTEGVSVVDPGSIVDAARNPESPLHPLFDWDDSSAAHQHRLEQARAILMRYRVIVRRGNDRAKLVKVVPGFVSVGSGYRPTSEVMGSRETAAEQIRYEWGRIDSLLARLALICSSNPDMASLERWCETTRSAGARAVSSACDDRGDAWRRAEG